MDLFKSLRSFVAVADAGSFSRAARASNLSPAAITRDIAALELHLGVRLLQRTTRQVRATSEGAAYLGHAKRILADLAEAEAMVRGTHGELVGPVSLTAPATFGRLHVTPPLIAFTQRHPQIVLRTVFLDRVVDLAEEGIDVAVRIAHLPDSSATAIRVGSVGRRLCAAPSYLAQHGEPKQLSDLNEHAAITLVNQPLPWRMSDGDRTTVVHPRPRMVVNTVDLATSAAEAGLGVVWLFSYQIEASVDQGRLRPILTEYETPGIPIHVVHLQGRSAPRRTRVLVEHLVESLRHRLGPV